MVYYSRKLYRKLKHKVVLWTVKKAMYMFIKVPMILSLNVSFNKIFYAYVHQISKILQLFIL